MSIPNGFNQITSLAAAKLITDGMVGGLPAETRYAIIVADVQDVMWRDDGTAPTATVGMPLTKGTMFIYEGKLGAIQFIAKTAGAVLNVTFYKEMHSFMGESMQTGGMTRRQARQQNIDQG